MIKIRLKNQEESKISAESVFRRAVRGYKKMKRKQALVGIPFGYPFGYPPIQVPIQISGVALKGMPVQVTGAQEERPPIEGVPLTSISGFPPPKEEREKVDLTKINIAYPLIPREPKTGEEVFAYVNIKWVTTEGGLLYFLAEPQLSQQEKELLEKIKTSLVEKLDIDFTTLRKGEARDYIKKKFEEMVNAMAGELPEQKRRQILYFIERDFIGLGKIEPLMQDPNIEDISCDGIGISLYITHRDSRIGTVKSNVAFESAEEVDSFVNKLAQRSGKTISIAQPLVDATLPDGSRLQVTLGTDIARRGSNFSIRKFTEKPLSPVDIMKFKTADSKIMAYLWLITEYGKSTLIGGGTATGKTSMLNALTLFIKQELKIITIEDTAELKLPHPHWIPHVARQPMAEMEGKKLGEVDLFDLLRESLRQRPDFIVVGEVRGREAYVLFQQISTGHPGMSTIHADSIERLADRLTTPPINLPASLIESLDIIAFISRIKYGNTYVRRITGIFEIVGFDRDKNVPITNEVFRWNAAPDRYDVINPSIVLKRISNQVGIPVENLQKEMADRTRILDWMLDRNITNFNDFANMVRLYYTNKERVLGLIER